MNLLTQAHTFNVLCNSYFFNSKSKRSFSSTVAVTIVSISFAIFSDSKDDFMIS